VVDADGQPVSGAEVYALKSDFTTGKIPTAHTDKDGTFLITGLKPGVYTISAGKEEDGYARTDSPFHSTGLTAAPQVDVNEAQTTSGVVVCFGPKAAKLVGSLVDASTNKLIKDPQSAEIVLRRIDHPDYSYSTAPSLQGVFEILVPPVPLTAEISAPGYEKKLLGSLHLIPGETKRMGVSLHPNR
jgi:hypothetical protein